MTIWPPFASAPSGSAEPLETQWFEEVTAEQFVTALKEGQFGRLEQALGRAQRRYEQGQSKEIELQRLLRFFDQADSRLGEHFAAWLGASPPSYGQLLALSRWLIAMGWQARGGRTSNHVSDRGWRDLHSALEQAEHYIGVAKGLSSRPLHAHLTQANIANTVGCSLSEEDIAAQNYPEWYREAIATDPSSFIARESMLYHLRTEWGGSEKMMLDYVRQQEEQGFAGSQKLWASYHAAVAHYLGHFKDDFGAASERASLAAQLDPQYLPLLFEHLTYAGAPREQLEKVLQDVLVHLTPRQNLGTNFYLAFSRAKDWYAPYAQRIGQHMLEQAKRGDDEALYMLGFYQLYRPDFAWLGALPLLKAARERGNVRAAGLIVQLGQKDPSNQPQWQKANAKAGGAEPTPAELQFQEDVLLAAQLGEADACWEVVRQIEVYKARFELTDEDRMKFLLLSADGGNDSARTLAAKLILDNVVRFTEDGELELVVGENIPTPTQRSLDYARWLLERASASGYEYAQEILNQTPEWRWDAEAIQRKVEIHRNRENFGRAAATSASKAPPAPAPQSQPPAKGGLGGLWSRLTGKK